MEGNEAVGAEEGDNGLWNIIGKDKAKDAAKGLGVRPGHGFVALRSGTVEGIGFENISEV